MKTAIYAGSFDPITYGHLWIIKQTSLLFGKLIIVIGGNSKKTYMIDLNTRVELIRDAVRDYANIEIQILDNQFLINFALSLNVKYLIRGIRNVNDYEYEKKMRYINEDICEQIQTIFLIPPREYAEISSSTIKSLIGIDGWENHVSKYIPPQSLQVLKNKIYHA